MNFFKKKTINRTYFIAEIGINHNGNIQNALKLIESAKLAGCDAVKFQKRSPEICTPKSQWDILRETPGEKLNILNIRRKRIWKKEYGN